MKALVFAEQGKPLEYTDFPDPVPGAGEVLVDLKAAALNRRDYFMTKGLYPNVKTPVILGSDGAGIAEGRAVVINPNQNWGDNPAFASKAYTILGMPSQGTLAEKTAVPADRLHPKPAHLNWHEAAVLPLGGLTAYRAIFTRGQLQAGQKVLITGAGGGVATLAIQLAVAGGGEVFVTSGSEEKLEKAAGLGVQGGANYHDENWPAALKEQAGGFDLVIDSAGGPGFNHLVKLTQPGGRLVVYGGSLGPVSQFSPQILFWRQLSVLGTTMGTDEEFAQMLELVTAHKIYPVIDGVFPLSNGQEAFARMAEGTQFGKIVVDTAC